MCVCVHAWSSLSLTLALFFMSFTPRSHSEFGCSYVSGEHGEERRREKRMGRKGGHAIQRQFAIKPIIQMPQGRPHCSSDGLLTLQTTYTISNNHVKLLYWKHWKNKPLFLDKHFYLKLQEAIPCSKKQKK